MFLFRLAGDNVGRWPENRRIANGNVCGARRKSVERWVATYRSYLVVAQLLVPGQDLDVYGRRLGLHHRQVLRHRHQAKRLEWHDLHHLKALSRKGGNADYPLQRSHRNTLSPVRLFLGVAGGRNHHDLRFLRVPPNPRETGTQYQCMPWRSGLIHRCREGVFSGSLDVSHS